MNGEIATTTPHGWRSVNASLAGAVRRRVDRHRLAVHPRALGRARAQERRRSVPPRLSPRASGLPTSDAIVRARSSRSRPSRSAARRRISERSHGDSLRIARAPSTAARDGALRVLGAGDRDDADDLAVERAPDLLLARDPASTRLRRTSSSDRLSRRRLHDGVAFVFAVARPRHHNGSDALGLPSTAGRPRPRARRTRVADARRRAR